MFGKLRWAVVLLLVGCNGSDDSGDALSADAMADRAVACATDCDDANPCTEDRCDTVVGECVHSPVPLGTVCDDLNACTRLEACDDAGTCVGDQIPCDDYLECTADGCDVAMGCTHEAAAGCQEPEPVSQVLVQPYLQDMDTDSVTVKWETVEECPGRLVLGPDINYGEQLQEEAPATIHEVTISQLEAGQDYRYRVFPCDDDVPMRGEYGFTTAPAEAGPFTFAVFGDNRSQPEVCAEVCLSIAESEPDLVLNVGDVVTDGTVYEQWASEYFGPISVFSAWIPSYIAIGNHEKDAHWFYDYVKQPDPENYFAITYSGARFVLLDTNDQFGPDSIQYAWLMEELASPEYQQADWRFFFFHHPPYSEQWDAPGYTGDFLVHIFLVPVLAEANVDALFVGHTHDYERGFVPDGQGFFYVITGGGGSPLDQVHNTDWEQIEFYASEYHHMAVDIDGDIATVSAILLDGSILDQFVIQH